MKAKGEPCEGRKPYSHYDGEDAAFERMKVLRATGLGYDRIAKALNAEGFKRRTGERWWGKTVNNILSAQAPAHFNVTTLLGSPSTWPMGLPYGSPTGQST